MFDQFFNFFFYFRANHLNKGKQTRDRRKLREKRRSTGVVHLQSTEVSLPTIIVEKIITFG